MSFMMDNSAARFEKIKENVRYMVEFFEDKAFLLYNMMIDFDFNMALVEYLYNRKRMIVLMNNRPNATPPEALLITKKRNYLMEKNQSIQNEFVKWWNYSIDIINFSNKNMALSSISTIGEIADRTEFSPLSAWN